MYDIQSVLLISKNVTSRCIQLIRGIIQLNKCNILDYLSFDFIHFNLSVDHHTSDDVSPYSFRRWQPMVFDGATKLVDIHDTLEIQAGTATWSQNLPLSSRVRANLSPRRCCECYIVSVYAIP